MRRVSEDMQDEHRYDDMLAMEHHVSKNHRQMPRIDRAAQFAPFAALTGYNESINEASRKPEPRIELSETQIEELNERIAVLAEHAEEHPVIAVRYYHLEEEKAHQKIARKNASEKNEELTSKRRRIQKMEQETSVRQKARGKKEVIGCYITERKQLKRIDAEHQVMIFTDRTEIRFSDLLSVDSAVFNQWEAE